MAGMMVPQQDLNYGMVGAQSGGAVAADYLSVFSRRKWTIVIPFVLCIAASFVIAKLIPKQFQGSVLIEVIDRQALDKFFGQVDLTIPYKPYLASIAETIRTRNFLSDLVSENKITEGYDVSNARERNQLLDLIRRNIDIKMIVNETKAGSDLIEVFYTGQDAQKVMNFVNAIAAKYQRILMDTYMSEIRYPLKNMERRRADAETKHNAAALAFENFQREEDWPSIGEKALVNRKSDLERVTTDLDRERIDLQGKLEKLDKLSQIIGQVPAEVAIKTTQELNPAWSAQKAKVDTLETELQELSKKWYPSYGKVRDLALRLENERDRLTQTPEFKEVSRDVGKNVKFDDLDLRRADLESDIKAAEARIDKLEALARNLTTETDRLPELISRERTLREAMNEAFGVYDRFNRVYAQVKGTYDRLLTKEGQFFRTLRSPIAQEAAAWAPVFPKIPLFIGIGAFAGLLIGAGLAFIMEFGSRSFVTVSQVRRTLPVTFLGQVGALTTIKDEQDVVSRRRVVKTAVVVALIAIVAAHALFFVPQFRAVLPTPLFDAMTRVWGAR